MEDNPRWTFSERIDQLEAIAHSMEQLAGRIERDCRDLCLDAWFIREETERMRAARARVDARTPRG